MGYAKNIIEIVESLKENIVVKLMGGFSISAVTFLLDIRLKDQYTALLLLILFDAVSAIFVAYKTGQAIESRRFIKTAFKIVAYFGMISAGRLAEYSTPQTFCLIDETILWVCTLNELISIIENIGKLGYVIPKKLLNTMKEYRDGK
jgi:phage-related holin